MKRILVITAILALGIAFNAQAWIRGINPQSADGQGAVVMPVYNNSGGALDEGDVVVWDIGSSTGDNDIYVTTTTTANTGLVAGVVTEAGCATASACSIIVFGPAQCDTAAAVISGETLCSSTTAGAGDSCTATDGSGSYAYTATNNTAAGQLECFVHLK